ncbi:hypothetical protein BV20DRAFT_967500 [Pilatotrama ljubarskyi]|nr:hypothetical protein BV20DRAFT_967500 [Pilatotrama ljubarskyi]
MQTGFPEVLADVAHPSNMDHHDCMSSPFHSVLPSSDALPVSLPESFPEFESYRGSEYEANVATFYGNFALENGARSARSPGDSNVVLAHKPIVLHDGADQRVPRTALPAYLPPSSVLATRNGLVFMPGVDGHQNLPTVYTQTNEPGTRLNHMSCSGRVAHSSAIDGGRPAEHLPTQQVHTRRRHMVRERASPYPAPRTSAHEQAGGTLSLQRSGTRRASNLEIPLGDIAPGGYASGTRPLCVPRRASFAPAAVSTVPGEDIAPPHLRSTPTVALTATHYGADRHLSSSSFYRIPPAPSSLVPSNNAAGGMQDLWNIADSPMDVTAPNILPDLVRPEQYSSHEQVVDWPVSVPHGRDYAPGDGTSVDLASYDDFDWTLFVEPPYSRR